MNQSIKQSLTSDRTKPYTRWWWFRDEIAETDIKHQLEWLAKNNFGGVEIAWAYPVKSPTSGPTWLSPEWTRLAKYAKSCAETINLGCDFTFGSMWPFGGSFVKSEHACKEFGGKSRQRLDNSWEFGEQGPVNILDHLSKKALAEYSEVMGKALKPALEGGKSALFCDSWELRAERLRTNGLERLFENQFGYALEPFVPKLAYLSIRDQGVLYDYRKLISRLIIDNFYKEFTKKANDLGAKSRVQCHGSPTDLVKAYCSADIPESEAILFDTPFSRIAASAGALGGKKVVSAEAFTCLYGFSPARNIGTESIKDVKAVADSLFANGINHIVWHGMPFNSFGGTNKFYANTHVGPDSQFADQLASFNEYLERVSKALQTGKTQSNVAVYLPVEDNWIKGLYPLDLRRPGGIFHYDLRHVRTPDKLEGHNPLWVSMGMLESAEGEDRQLKVGDVTFSQLYVDTESLDRDSLNRIYEFAKRGLPICMKKKPDQPGYIKTEDYHSTLDRMLSLGNVTSTFNPVKPPMLEGEQLPENWIRREGDETTLFLAHPDTRRLAYPMQKDELHSTSEVYRRIKLNIDGKERSYGFSFKPNQSLLVRLDKNLNMK